MDFLREKKWPSVIAVAVTISDYLVTVDSTAGFHPKQIATLSFAGQSAEFEIKRIASETQLQLGPIGRGIGVYSNPTQFNGGTLCAVDQDRNAIDMDAAHRAVYAEEPTVALRNALVDYYGRYIGPDNPLSVSTPPLGTLGMPKYIERLLGSLEYDSVTSTIVGNVETLTFSLHGADLFNITLTQTATGWQVGSAGLFSYILQETGEKILLEAGVGALIQEG